jgi:hypothetical protein
MSDHPSAPSAPEIITIQVGRVDRAVTLSVLKLPPTTASISAKGQAFDFALQALKPHSETFDFGEKTAFFLALAPRSIGTSLMESQAFGLLLRKQLFEIGHISANAFLYGDGSTVAPDDIFCKLENRTLNITTFSFNSTTDPSLYVPTGVKLPGTPFTIALELDLPQTTQAQAPTIAGTPISLTHQFDNTATPITLAALQNDISQVGNSDGTDLMSDYANDVIMHLNQAKLQNLCTRFHDKTQIKAQAPNAQPPATPASLFRITTTPVTSSTTTFMGDVNFLETQEGFDITFPVPTPTGP